MSDFSSTHAELPSPKINLFVKSLSSIYLLYVSEVTNNIFLQELDFSNPFAKNKEYTKPEQPKFRSIAGIFLFLKTFF